jgi:hypothetical protein
MVPLTALVVPIVLSAVLVFVVSSLIHMVLQIHRHDWRRLPIDEEVLAALRRANVPPGDYMAPYAGSSAEMKSPEFRKKMEEGPWLIATVARNSGSFGTSLAMWFAYAVLMSLFAAYLAGRALGPGAVYLDVFRFAGTTAFAGYSLALLQNSIWYKRNWGSTLKSVLDGLIYALLTAGTFGWLWPR